MKQKPFLYIIILFLLSSCANMLAPTGGPEDRKPPVVKKSEPINNQRNYQKSFIKMTFDEYVAIDNLNSELIVSPPLKYKPENKISGKTVTITWKDTLEVNTTYTFNFGNSIKDINEGNIVENHTVTFSTGADIDSASFTGEIKKVDDNEALKGAFVFLSEKEFGDSTFFPVKAQYQTKTNSQGNFTFQGLKPAKYNLYFLEDNNTNKIPDNGEYVGFSDTQIIVKYPEIKDENDTTKIEKPSFTNTFKAFPFYQENRRVFKSFNPNSSQYIAAIWQENIFGENVKAFIDSQKLFSFNSKDTLWIFSPHKDTFQVEIKNEIGEIIFVSDSIKMLSKPDKLILKSQDEKLAEDFDSAFVIQSNQKIVSVDTSKFELKYDSLKITPRVTCGEHYIYVWHQWEEGKNYEIKLSDSAFQYMDTLWNKKTKPFKYSLPEKKTLSSFEIKINRKSEEFQSIALIVKIDFSGKIFYKYLSAQDSVISLHNIKSGSYKMTFYGDKNENRIWDTGDIIKYEQAEPVYEIPQPIDVKEGWDGSAEIEL